MIANDSPETPGLPSSADLDAAEERVREATGIRLQEACGNCGHNRLEHATRIYGPGCPCGCKRFADAVAPTVEDSQAFEEWHSRSVIHSGEKREVQLARYYRKQGWDASRRQIAAQTAATPETT